MVMFFFFIINLACLDVCVGCLTPHVQIGKLPLFASPCKLRLPLTHGSFHFRFGYPTTEIIRQIFSTGVLAPIQLHSTLGDSFAPRFNVFLLVLPFSCGIASYSFLLGHRLLTTALDGVPTCRG